MICSYADESGDQKVYSVSALLSKLEDFVDLGRAWRSALKDEGLPEFHSSWLEQRKEPYENLERFQRDHIQKRFIRLIAERPIWGFHSSVELDAYKRHEAELKAILNGYQDPYLLTFRSTIESMAIEVNDYEVQDEPIAFVFDQQKQYEGRSKDLYERLAQTGNWPLAHRLGSITFESRLTAQELQAADAWAYESRKYVTEHVINKDPERWQWRIFADTGRFNVSGHTKDTIPKTITRAEQEKQDREKASGGRS